MAAKTGAARSVRAALLLHYSCFTVLFFCCFLAKAADVNTVLKRQE